MNNFQKSPIYFHTNRINIYRKMWDRYPDPINKISDYKNAIYQKLMNK
jgi:hypothetical protein